MTSEVWKGWVLPVVVLAVSGALGLLVGTVVLRRLRVLAERSSTRVDDLLLGAFQRHVPLWFLLGGVAVAVRVAPGMPDRFVVLADRVAAIGFILSLAFAASGFGGALLTRQAERRGLKGATTSLAQTAVRVAVFAIAGLMILAHLRINITPILATLGIGSLAVALALQPTLSNLFAGIHLTVARQIRVGDFVKLEQGLQGFVEDIGWRSTRIRELPNNLIVVPNARLAEMVVTNYSLPETEQSVVVPVGVAYGSDLGEVERVTIEVACEVLREVQGGVPGFEPFIRYNTFGDSAIGFSVILRVQDFVSRYLVVHEFHKRLKARYDREGIEIPFPQRVLHGPGGGNVPPG